MKHAMGGRQDVPGWIGYRRVAEVEKDQQFHGTVQGEVQWRCYVEVLCSGDGSEDALPSVLWGEHRSHHDRESWKLEEIPVVHHFSRRLFVVGRVGHWDR
jgi:hypothetical protein